MKAEVRKLYQVIIKNGESSGRGLASRDMLHKLLIYSIHTFGSGSECNFLPFVDTKASGEGTVDKNKILGICFRNDKVYPLMGSKNRSLI